MATVTNWNPYGVALNVTATAGTVTRISATKYTVVLNVSWKCYWSGNSTNYGMSATAGGETETISSFGTSRSSGSASFTGTFSISGTGKQAKSIAVTFKNFNTDKGQSASKNVTLSVSVPAWPTYAVKYSGNATGASNIPAAQTKVKGTTLKLSSTRPTRTGHAFQGWGTTAADTSANYQPGGNYTADAAATLYAIWKANTYTVKFDANGGSGAPSAATKTYGKDLTLPTAKPTLSGYNFLGWGLSASDTTATYQPGGNYSKNSAATLYAVWELGYWKPKVTNLSVERCDASGNPVGEGTHFKLNFDWECCQALGANPVTGITVSWGTVPSTLAANGTYSGHQEHVLGGDLSPEMSYEVVVTVADASGSTPATATVSSCAYAIDFKAGGKGAAFGKEAELDGLDINWTALFRKNWTMANNAFLGVEDAAGEWMNVLGMNENGNLLFGYDLYAKKRGNSVFYGNNQRFNAAEDMTFIIGAANAHEYRPYFRKGDSLAVAIRTAGFVTNNKTEVWFWVPLAKPILGTPVVTATSPNNGFIIRQGGNYTHGSTSAAFVKPDTYATGVQASSGVRICATFASTANAVNNEACGVYWSGTITFS